MRFETIQPQTRRVPRVSPTVYWRVEGSLLDLTVVQPVAFIYWNAANLLGSASGDAALFFWMAALRPFFVFDQPQFADACGTHGAAGCDARPAGLCWAKNIFNTN